MDLMGDVGRQARKAGPLPRITIRSEGNRGITELQGHGTWLQLEKGGRHVFVVEFLPEDSGGVVYAERRRLR